MNINKIRKLKGFMPDHEGDALMKWSEKFSKLGPVMEIGTYCGKSTMYLSKGACINNQNYDKSKLEWVILLHQNTFSQLIII